MDQNNKFLRFDVESAEVIEEDPNSQFATIKIQAFSSGMNRHDLTCSVETLKRTAPTIYNKPILYNVDKTFDDFGSHTDPDKSLIAGFVVPDSAEFEELQDGTNRTALSVIAKLWKKYAPKVVEFFKQSDGFKKVSVEMELYDSSPLDQYITEMKDFAYFGVCLLGDLITEASPGAHAQVLSFAKENEKYKEAYEKEFSSRYSELDLSIPKKVRKNSEKALSLYKKNARGANSVILSLARFLQKNEYGTPEKIRNMAKLLKRYSKREFEENDEDPSNDYIAYLALGGVDGLKWSNELIQKFEEIDNRKFKYFENAGEIIGKEENHSMGDEEEKKNVENPEEDSENMAENQEPTEQEEENTQMAESPEEEEKEKEEDENYSLDAYLDVSAMLAMLEDETENYRQIVEFEFARGEKTNFAKAFGAVFSKMQKMCDDMKKMAEDHGKMKDEHDEMKKKHDEMMAENEDLKQFKAQVEQERFNSQIMAVMSEVKEDMPKAEFEALQERSREFSLDTVDAFKNLVRATAFEFSKGKKSKNEGDDILRFDLVRNDPPKKESHSSWNRLGV